MSINEKMASKVRRLLALSTSSNEHEASLALLRAQEFMVKYGLSMMDVQDGGEVKKEVIELETADYGKSSWHSEQLIMVIADNFRCYPFKNCIRGKSKMVLIGIKADAELALELYRASFAWLESSMSDVRRTYLHDDCSRGYANGCANDYAIGFLQGLKAKFKEQVDKNGWGLILVKDDALIEHWESKTGLKTGRRGHINRNRSNNEYDSGYQAGRNYDHTTRAIAGSSK